MTAPGPEELIRTGVDRYRAVVDAQREEAEKIRAEREAAQDDGSPTIREEGATA